MTPRIIYQFWTGNNAITPNRDLGLQTSRENFKIPVKLVTKDNLDEYIVKEHPLHPCYNMLSDVHKADYLRCYFMNFHGGGYADIKKYGPDNNFAGSFQTLDDHPESDIIGQAECNGGAAFATYNQDHRILSHLIAAGYFIAKPHSEFTEKWYRKMISYMNVMSKVLYEHPSTDPYGGNGYPIPWVYLLGNPFHHTCWELSKKRPYAVLRSLVSGHLQEPYR